MKITFSLAAKLFVRPLRRPRIESILRRAPAVWLASESPVTALFKIRIAFIACILFIAAAMLGCKPAPIITSFTSASNSVEFGGATTLIAVFKNGTGVIDHGIGKVSSGTEITTGKLVADTTFTLTVTNSDGKKAVEECFVAVTPVVPTTTSTLPTTTSTSSAPTTSTTTSIVPTTTSTLPTTTSTISAPTTSTTTTIERTMEFVTEGESFAPVLIVKDNPEILWVWSDGKTSSSATPNKSFGSALSRSQKLLVRPWSAIQRINIGFDGGDGGDMSIEQVADQHVSSVSGMDLVAPTLGQWCSSYNQITALDFSNFISLDTIECYYSHGLTSVNLSNTPLLKRACFEACDLHALDLSDSPLLEDLRGAENAYDDIKFSDNGDHVWHICVRDNPQITNQSLFADMGRFPSIAELFIWYDNQSGSLRLPSSHKTRGVSLLAEYNHYSALDLSGSLLNPASYGAIDFRNNQLSSINITGCVQITEMYLENNLLEESQIDGILATLDSLGRNKDYTDIQTILMIDIRGNALPSASGISSANKLAAKGWSVVTDNWTFEPPAPSDTGEARIDFTTNGDTTRMRCDFLGSSTTATWHWSDGTTSAAISGEDSLKPGLSTGLHGHYLVISNGSALIGFGASEEGQGHLKTISGLNNAPYLAILYAYGEGDLTDTGRLDGTRLREYYLGETALSDTAMDQVFADAVSTGITGGTMWCPNQGTASGEADRATLLVRGWLLYYY